MLYLRQDRAVTEQSGASDGHNVHQSVIFPGHLDFPHVWTDVTDHTWPNNIDDSARCEHAILLYGKDVSFIYEGVKPV